MNNLQQKWDQRYAQSSYQALEPAPFLIDNGHLIPKSGRALELACGLGVNALYLAKQGLLTTAWDLSPVAIGALQNEAQVQGVELNAEVRDLSLEPPPANSFDLIFVTNFLDRALCSHIEHALRPGGVLFYQTWVVDKVSNEGPSNPQFLLAENELLRLFPNLSVRYFRDEGRLSDLDQGSCNCSMLIATKELRREP